MTDEQIKKINWLRRLQKAEKNALDCARIYERKREAAYSMKKAESSGISGYKKIVLEGKIADMLEAERQMNQAAEYAANVRNEVISAINQIPDRNLANILIVRYTMHKTAEETAEILNYSLASFKRMHKKALDLLKVEPF